MLFTGSWKYSELEVGSLKSKLIASLVIQSLGEHSDRVNQYKNKKDHYLGRSPARKGGDKDRVVPLRKKKKTFIAEPISHGLLQHLQNIAVSGRL